MKQVKPYHRDFSTIERTTSGFMATDLSTREVKTWPTFHSGRPPAIQGYNYDEHTERQKADNRSMDLIYYL
jgi:hypothetical protein